ncbi:ABC transporter permease [Pararhizobium sp. IMCC21322]|uniref:ABC transporter permease n=1 Tax=Pararhizobium sp. IMCC21322 TaxID=3067903 RepID=UPI002741C8A5|nr:ABC transporter permease [Pararhizobium sp. IMCC21322]
MEMYEAIILTIITAATPLLLAACGELVAERAGILNLGVEGMMIMGAVGAFAVAFTTGSPYLGIAAGIAAGAAASLPFAFLTISMVTNQVATGLALTILGLGLSGMIGDAYIGQPGVKLPPISVEGLSDLPYVGKILFSQDVIVYASIFLLLFVWIFLFKTRAGLSLRAVGDSHSSAHALGVSVRKVRYLAVIFGGACAGLAGAYLSLVYTPQWTEGMTAGRGWIAVVLVVFATWMPGRLLAGAYLFGAVAILQLHAQAAGVNIPSQFLSSLPYLATIIVLVLISRNRTLVKKNSPACLGKPFVPDV